MNTAWVDGVQVSCVLYTTPIPVVKAPITVIPIEKKRVEVPKRSVDRPDDKKVGSSYQPRKRSESRNGGRRRKRSYSSYSSSTYTSRSRSRSVRRR